MASDPTAETYAWLPGGVQGVGLFRRRCRGTSCAALTGRVRKHVRDVVWSAGVDVDAEGEDPVVELGQVEWDLSVEFATDVVVPVGATEAFGEGVAGSSGAEFVPDGTSDAVLEVRGGDPRAVAFGVGPPFGIKDAAELFGVDEKVGGSKTGGHGSSLP